MAVAGEYTRRGEIWQRAEGNENEKQILHDRVPVHCLVVRDRQIPSEVNESAL